MIGAFDLLGRTTHHNLSELHEAPFVCLSSYQNGRAADGGMALAFYSNYSINQGAKNGMLKNQ
jgi:hypothetical protein